MHRLQDQYIFLFLLFSHFCFLCALPSPRGRNSRRDVYRKTKQGWQHQISFFWKSFWAVCLIRGRESKTHTHTQTRIHTHRHTHQQTHKHTHTHTPTPFALPPSPCAPRFPPSLPLPLSTPLPSPGFPPRLSSANPRSSTPHPYACFALILRWPTHFTLNEQSTVPNGTCGKL
jgi:hypothetical protein